MQTGYNAGDNVLIDFTGGFGGTWYWNRYPGLMYDVASEVYMPLLEEMKYVPQHKYSYGYELRAYAENVANCYGLENQAMFRTTVTGVSWHDQDHIWSVNVSRAQESPSNSKTVLAEMTAVFLIMTPGPLNYPKLPDIPGIHDHQSHQFHTSSWDYKYTGGSQDRPNLVNLRD